jgi:hypothetical protein
LSGGQRRRVVTHRIRDAYSVATHHAVREAGTIRVFTGQADQTRFMVLHDGGIVFEGAGQALPDSAEPSRGVPVHDAAALVTEGERFLDVHFPMPSAQCATSA